MKLRSISVIAAAALALSLSACGSGNENNTTSNGGTTAVTLSVWAPSEDQATDTSWLQTQEKAFEAAHTDYTITWNNSIVSEGDAANTVKQDASAAADVYMFANDQLGALVQANAIGVLPPASISQVQSQNVDVMVTSVTGTDGQLYGVPYTANTWFMYYDKSKFTDDDITSLDAMLAKGKVAFPLDNGWYLAAFYVGNGCTLFGPDGTDESAGFDFSGTKASDVTAYLAGLVANPNFVNDDKNSVGLAGLKSGEISAFFSGSWDAANVKDALGDNYAAAQPPSFTLNGKQVPIKAFAGSKAVAFNPNVNPANATIAAQFAAFLGSTAAQQAHYTMRGIIPSDNALASDPAVTADPVAVAQMDTVQNASIFQPTVATMGNYWDPAASFGKALLSGDVTAANAVEKTEAWNTSLAG